MTRRGIPTVRPWTVRYLDTFGVELYRGRVEAPTKFLAKLAANDEVRPPLEVRERFAVRTVTPARV